MVHFLHVGMPKTASTWLQDAFFAGHPQLAVLGSAAHDGDLHAPFVAEVRRLALASDLRCDVPAFGRTTRELAAELRRRREQDGRAVRVAGLSHEVLSGAWPTGRNSRACAQALARCFPDAKIVVVLREQRGMLESSYKEFVRQGGTVGFRPFLLAPRAVGGYLHDADPLHSNTVAHFEYAPFVALYRELFGAQNVHVDSMERLQRNPAAFTAGLCDFLGVTHFTPPPSRGNPQLSPAALRVLRWLNHLFCTPYHPRFGPMPLARLLARLRGRGANRDLLAEQASARLQRAVAGSVLPALDRWLLRRLPGGRAFRYAGLPQDLRNWLEDLYRRDNRALAELVPFDLRELGWLLPVPGAGAACAPAPAAEPAAVGG